MREELRTSGSTMTAFLKASAVEPSIEALRKRERERKRKREKKREKERERMEFNLLLR